MVFFDQKSHIIFKYMTFVKTQVPHVVYTKLMKHLTELEFLSTKLSQDTMDQAIVL